MGEELFGSRRGRGWTTKKKQKKTPKRRTAMKARRETPRMLAARLVKIIGGPKAAAKLKAIGFIMKAR